MAAKTIEAILRISADVAGALAGLKKVREEGAKQPTQGGGGTDGATARRQAKEATDAGRAATNEHKAQAKARSTADRVAAAEALAAKKAGLQAQAEAERAARRQQRQADEEELRRKRKLQAQADRDDLQSAASKKRAEREATRKLGQVAPQVTDIVTGLAGGQNPLMVALQQGGQLRDIFGGFGNAGRALLQVLTPMRLLVTGVAAGFAVLAVNVASGYFESERLRKSLALSGNAAGTSLGQVNALAQGIAQSTATSIGTARDIVEGLLGVAGQTSNTLGETGRAAAALAKLSGASAAEAVKAFEDQAQGITDWAIKSNKAYNFLTAEQVAYIRRLESQGRTEEATRFVNSKLADTLIQRTGPALGTLEKAWSATTRAVSSFLDQLKALGRDDTAETKLKKLQDRLDEIRKRQAQPLFAGRRRSTDAAETAGIEQEQNTVRRDQLRTTENAIDLRAAQDAIREQTKQWQASITAVTVAEANKRLQAQLAALDKQMAAVELADAQGLTSERDKALALNRIDQDRLRAQIEAQKVQAARARAAVDLEAKPEDRRSAEAAAIEAEAQLISTQSRLQAVVADARRIVSADLTSKARDEAQAWADAWQRAADQVRGLAADNALTAAGRNPDPAARADAEAALRRADLQREVDATARDLKVRIGLAITPEARDELRQQLGSLLLEGSQAMDELARRAKQTSLQQTAGDLLQQVQLTEQAIDQAVTRGAITTEEAERRKFAARDAALPQLRQMLELLQALATTDGERNAVAGLLLQLDQLSDKTTELGRTLKASIGSNFASAFTDLVTGAETAEDAVRKGLAGIARSMLDLIAKRLGEQLVNSLFDGAGGGGSNQGWLGQLLGAFVTSKHSGGLIDGSITAGRRVAPWVFHGAQVLHSGGIAGLRADEQPAILMKGEEVLTADDPRHRNNLKAGSAGGSLIGNLNVSVSMDGTGNAGGDALLAQQVARLVESLLRRGLLEEMRPGGILQNVARG